MRTAKLVCADTNCWIRYWAGIRDWDTDELDAALAEGRLVMAPMVISELLSAPGVKDALATDLRQIPMLELKAGYWERAGRLRAQLQMAGYRPRMMDTLIALACLDHNVSLLTNDQDFRGFAKVAGLKLHHLRRR